MSEWTKEEWDKWWQEELEGAMECDDLAQIWHEKGYSWPSGERINEPDWVKNFAAVTKQAHA